MKRLTTYRTDGRAAIANNDRATPLQQTMKIPNIIDRLAAIEDILGNEYDLDRLRELAQADKEGISPCTFCRFKNIFITAKTEIPNAEPLSQTFSISEVEAALRRKQDS